MSQSDFGAIDANTKSGTDLASDLNNWRDALHSSHKGAAAPSYNVAGLIWLDDSATPWALKVYDGADWIVIGTVNATTNAFVPSIKGSVAIGSDFTPDGTAHVMTASAGAVTAEATGSDFVIENDDDPGMSILGNGNTWMNHNFGCPSDANFAGIAAHYNGGSPLFKVGTRVANGEVRLHSGNDSEAGRILSNGTVLITKTSDNIANSGVRFGSDGIAHFTKFQASPVSINRTSNDGVLVNLMQDGTAEGSISVSGTTVSFNGAHLSFLSQLPTTYGKRRDDTIKRGTVMEYCDEKCEWYYEDWEEEEIIPAVFIDEPTGLLDENEKPITKKVKVKDQEVIKHPKRLVVDGMGGGTGKGTVTKKANQQRMRSCPSITKGTPKAAGVFEQWDDDNVYNNKPEDKNTWNYDFRVATTGDDVIRVTGPCKIGDLLMSNGDGTAVVQDDDIIHAYTIAKVTQDFLNIPEGKENPELVPCQLLNG